MLKNKSVRITIITILASILSYSIVQACSFPEPQIIIKCSNLEASIEADNQSPNDTFKNLQAIVPKCAEDLTPVLDSFKQEITKWLDHKNKRFLLDRDLILEPYSVERDSELQKNENNLLSCRYEESKHVGNWLIIFETSRTYCLFWHAPGEPCPNIFFSLTRFLFYLATTLNLTTLPYQLGSLLTGAAIIYIWRALLKNRPAMKRSKIVALSIVIFALELFLTIMPFWVLGQTIGLILFFYVLVLWYKQIKVVPKQKTG